MAGWAMNYLIRTPRKEFDYEPAFQCHPLRCPPVPPGHDVVVPCDTDARMNWEWYYMRAISGVEAGKDVEAGFHARLLKYVQPDGTVLAPPGAYNEGDIHKVYTAKDYVYHVWGATKILHALAEDFRQTHNPQSRATGRKIIDRLRRLAVYQGKDKCYFPCGMGAMRQDGSVVPNFWNQHPAPVIEPLVNFYLATGDRDALDFARAYAEGILAGIQPGGLRFGPDGNFANPLGHSHATMHGLWGVAYLGVVTGETKYVDFAKRSWDWMLTRGTGTGWFPAMPERLQRNLLHLRHDVGRRDGRPQRAPRVLRLRRALSPQLHQQPPVHRHAPVRGLLSPHQPGGRRREDSPGPGGAAEVPGRHHRRLGPERL